MKPLHVDLLFGFAAVVGRAVEQQPGPVTRLRAGAVLGGKVAAFLLEQRIGPRSTASAPGANARPQLGPPAVAAATMEVLDADGRVIHTAPAQVTTRRPRGPGRKRGR